MVVSEDKKKAIFGFYCMRSNVNQLPGFLKLAGLSEDTLYTFRGGEYYGDELMNLGETLREMMKNDIVPSLDHVSFVEVLEAKQ